VIFYIEEKLDIYLFILYIIINLFFFFLIIIFYTGCFWNDGICYKEEITCEGYNNDVDGTRCDNSPSNGIKPEGVIFIC
jgi:hypothetical protein